VEHVFYDQRRGIGTESGARMDHARRCVLTRRLVEADIPFSVQILSWTTPKPRKTKKELSRSRIERCPAGLEEAVSRCRPEDADWGGLCRVGFLERSADEKWPFEQFQHALDEFDVDTDNKLKAEARWQVL